jgi:Tfp pilus assembly protein PilN
MTNINFVRHRRRELTKLEVQDRKLLRYSVMAVGAVVALTIVVMGVRLFLAYSNTRTNQSITKLNKEISAKQAIENEYLIFMAKAKVIAELFGQRREKQQALAYFSSLFDPSVIISRLSYDGETHALSFTLRAPSVFSLQTVFDTLRSSKVRETYPTFKIERIARSDDASYSVAIALPLQEAAIEPVAGTDGLSDVTGIDSEAAAPEEVMP